MSIGDRELDAMVAEKVMALRVVTPTLRKPMTMSGCRIGECSGPVIDTGEESTWGNRAASIPSYSCSIADACLVVETMRKRGFHVSISDIGSPVHWRVSFQSHAPGDALGLWVHSSLPWAICVAALRALGVSVDA